MRSDEGERLARRYDVDTVPTFLVFAGDGDIALREEGSPTAPVPELRRALEGAGA